MPLGISIGAFIFAGTASGTVIIVENPYIEDEIEEVMAAETSTEEEIEWTEERIKEEIRKVFPENGEEMIRVASCEGVKDGRIHAEAYNAATDDHGVLQINEYYHGKTYRALGFTNMKDPIQNLAYGKILYDQSGLQPWSASKPCWSK